MQRHRKSQGQGKSREQGSETGWKKCQYVKGKEYWKKIDKKSRIKHKESQCPTHQELTIHSPE